MTMQAPFHVAFFLIPPDSAEKILNGFCSVLSPMLPNGVCARGFPNIHCWLKPFSAMPIEPSEMDSLANTSIPLPPRAALRIEENDLSRIYTIRSLEALLAFCGASMTYSEFSPLVICPASCSTGDLDAIFETVDLKSVSEYREAPIQADWFVAINAAVDDPSLFLAARDESIFHSMIAEFARHLVEESRWELYG